jgi:large subunit ribosomal protein L15|tara:strand:+ start:2968 stop:3426 length:459 start_codon:yes stop_codon:yes gene_type:complete
MKLNTINNKIHDPKIRPGRGIGSGKGKTSGRGHKGQKSRSGVAIKSFEGGQMPLYRRLPKRGFKNFNSQKSKIAIINISDIEKFVGIKRIPITEKINLKSLQNLKLINKKYERLKILGNGEIKNKINIEANKVSKPAKTKIESAGGTISIIK